MRRLLAIALLGSFVPACLDVSATGRTSDSGGSPPPGGGNPTVSFQQDIADLFRTECARCHGGAGGLDLDSYSGLMAGGNSGPTVLPGDPGNSLLVKRLDGTTPPAMPLDGPALSGPEIDTIRQWILEGALDN